MKRFVLISLLLFCFFSLHAATITWDGGGGDGLWSTPANWNANVVPGPTDDVVLDNSSVIGSYIVTFPGITTTISVNTLIIAPTLGNNIQLIMPSSNTASPGLNVTGSGDAFILNSGAVFTNSSGVGYGIVSLFITNTFRINNGAKYVHNNIGDHASIVSQLSTIAGTEKGIFEFDVPLGGIGGSSVLVSLSGRNMGTLIFSSTTGGTMGYVVSGSNDLIVRGDFVVNNLTGFTSTLTSNILIGGDFFNNNGVIQWIPSVFTGNGRFIFDGSTPQNASITGSMPTSSSVNFNGYTVQSASSVILQTDFYVDQGIFKVDGTLTCGTHLVIGFGIFSLSNGGTLGIGSPNGITASALSGNIQTSGRNFNSASNYIYNASTTQVTGDGLPAGISGTLKINNSSGLGTTGVTLSQAVAMDGLLDLTLGKLTSTLTNLVIINSTGTLNVAPGGVSFVAGPMKKIGSTSFDYPIGKGTEYAPLSLIGAGVITDAFIAEYFMGNPRITFGPNFQSPPVDHMSTLEWWTVDRNSGTSNKEVGLQVRTYSMATALINLDVIRWDGTIWQDEGQSSSAGVSVGQVISNVVSNFLASGTPTPFTLGSTTSLPANPLPIQLVTFNALKGNGNTSIINWSLAICCSSAAKFELEKSADGRIFSSFTTIPGSDVNISYAVNDNNLATGITYYRLKMTDASGIVSYSRTVAVINDTKGLLITSLYPNPVINNAILALSAAKPGSIGLRICDFSGKTVMQWNSSIGQGSNTIPVDLGKLPAGIYNLVAIVGDAQSVYRFIKQ